MKILDLYCGVGGASMGIHLAGHEVVGIDINPQPDYPFEFIQMDVRELSDPRFREFMSSFDAIHASPPCQAYSYATTQWRNLGNEYPDLVYYTRSLLMRTRKPFVLENVPNAPLRKDLLLCYGMFDDGTKNYIVRRHRIFEIHGFEVPQPEHKTHKGRVGDGRVISVFGHGGGKRYNHATSDLNAWKEAMGLPWATKRKSIAEAIPPEYTKYIFSHLKG